MFKTSQPRLTELVVATGSQGEALLLLLFFFLKVSIGKGTFKSQVVVNSSQIKPFYRLLPLLGKMLARSLLCAEKGHVFPSCSYLLLSHAFYLHLQQTLIVYLIIPSTSLMRKREKQTSWKRRALLHTLPISGKNH